jgi:fermentation-respiration switch protein FrsA (DUF1100 family)
MTTQPAFAAALLDPGVAVPPGLRSWNGSDPRKRFDVYRNNVMVGLVDALADTYPVVQALVGEPFFRAAAAAFARRHPPQSPVLAWYGEGFAAFVEALEPARSLPYLADVARLEWLRVLAWHAADAKAVPMNRLAELLTDAEHLPLARLTLHPALHVMNSPHPVVSLWAAHQCDDPGAALGQIDMTCGEAALLLRPELGVEILRIEPGAAAFVRLLLAGEPLGTAALGGGFALAETLGVLVRHRAIVAVTTVTTVNTATARSCP